MSEQMKKIFGVDLGTTYSSIAYVDEFGKPIVVPNAENQLVTPSVVLFDKNDVIVGDVAKESAKLYPDRVVSFVKRVMGEPAFLFEHNSKAYRAEEISSFILRKVVKDAEKNLGEKITDVVITCPAYFGINEREATRRAGEIAGFNVRQIINEPTAAAIAYASMKPPEKQVVVVYDLGGGTFDITLIDIQPDSIEVICTGGDHNLGGKDWDDCFVADLAQEFRNKTGLSMDILEDPETCQELLLTAEKSKKALGQRKKVPITITHGGKSIKIEYERRKLETITQALLERTISFTHDMLTEAKKKGYNRFDEIILVGGATRMPQVADRIEQEFSMKPRIFDPDCAVAKGAAIYGWKLSLNDRLIKRIAQKTGKKIQAAKKPVAPSSSTKKEKKIIRQYSEIMNIEDAIEASSEKVVNEAVQEMADETGYSLPAVKGAMAKIRDVASKSFGIVVETSDNKEVVYNLILKNTTVPVDIIKTFPTGMDNQDTVLLRIMENEVSEQNVPLESSTEIGTAILSLPQGLPSGSPIDICFELNDEGRLQITANEKTKLRSVSVDIKTISVIQGKELEDAMARGQDIVVN